MVVIIWNTSFLVTNNLTFSISNVFFKIILGRSFVPLKIKTRTFVRYNQQKNKTVKLIHKSIRRTVKQRFTVRPYHRTLLVKLFRLIQNKMCSKSMAKRSNIVGQTFEICLSSNMFDGLATSKTLLIKQFLAKRYAKNVFEAFQKHCQTGSACQAMFCDVAKLSNIACKANLW